MIYLLMKIFIVLIYFKINSWIFLFYILIPLNTYRRILIMKKLLGLLFASTLILGACGGHKDSSESDSSNKSSDSVSVDKSDDSEKTDSKFKMIN